MTKTRLAMLIAILAATVTLAGSASANDYAVDPVHSTVWFKVKHLGINFVYGRFNEYEGTLSFAPENPEAPSNTQVTVKTASVDTGNETRDQHLRGEDYFDVANHPTMSFKSGGWEKKGDDYLLKGDFTLMGETKTISVPVQYLGSTKGMQGEDRVGFETTFTIKRSDYGMTTSLGPVGDEIEVTLAIEAVKVEPAPGPATNAE